jgi:hypothetical protein
VNQRSDGVVILTLFVADDVAVMSDGAADSELRRRFCVDYILWIRAALVRCREEDPQNAELDGLSHGSELRRRR